MHKNTKLLPYERREIFRRWGMSTSVASLAREYKVSRQTIYKVARHGKLHLFFNRSSENLRYRNIAWGLKRLGRTEQRVAARLSRREHRLNRYEKSIPGEMIHLDTKRLPLLSGESPRLNREYLFVAVDDYSRFLFADIFPDKTSYSAAIFAEEVRRFCPFPIQTLYSDNGSEYKGRADHPVSVFCRVNRISHSFTQVKHPWTNGKAERVIKTLMTEWHQRTRPNHLSRSHRRRHLYAFVDYYNQLRVHQSIGTSPLARLESFLQSVNNA